MYGYVLCELFNLYRKSGGNDVPRIQQGVIRRRIQYCFREANLHIVEDVENYCRHYLIISSPKSQKMIRPNLHI